LLNNLIHSILKDNSYSDDIKNELQFIIDLNINQDNNQDDNQYKDNNHNIDNCNQNNLVNPQVKYNKADKDILKKELNESNIIGI